MYCGYIVATKISLKYRRYIAIIAIFGDIVCITFAQYCKYDVNTSRTTCYSMKILMYILTKYYFAQGKKKDAHITLEMADKLDRICWKIWFTIHMKAPGIELNLL